MRTKALGRANVVLHAGQSAVNRKPFTVRTAAAPTFATRFVIVAPRDENPGRRRSIVSAAGTGPVDVPPALPSPAAAEQDFFGLFEHLGGDDSQPWPDRDRFMASVKSSGCMNVGPERAAVLASAARAHAAELVARAFGAWDWALMTSYTRDSDALASSFEQCLSVARELLKIATHAASRCEPAAVRNAELASTFQTCLGIIRSGMPGCVLQANRIVELVGGSQAGAMQQELREALGACVNATLDHGVHGPWKPHYNMGANAHGRYYGAIWGEDAAALRSALDHMQSPGAGLLDANGRGALLRQIELVCAQRGDDPAFHDLACESALGAATQAEGDEMRARAINGLRSYVLRTRPDGESLWKAAIDKMLSCFQSIGGAKARQQARERSLHFLVAMGNLPMALRVCRGMLALGADRRALEGTLAALLNNSSAEQDDRPRSEAEADVIHAAVFTVIVDRFGQARELSSPLRYPLWIRRARTALLTALADNARFPAGTPLTQADWDELAAIAAAAMDRFPKGKL